MFRYLFSFIFIFIFHSITFADLSFSEAFQKASQKTGDYPPFHFPVGPNEKVGNINKSGIGAHELTQQHSRSETERTLRNTILPLYKFREQTGMRQFGSHLPKKEQQNAKVVMVKNKRGGYVPKIISRMQDQSWNPQWPSRGVTFHSAGIPDPDNAFWATDSKGELAIQTCSSQYSLAEIKERKLCSANAPIQRTCSYDQYLKDSPHTIASMGAAEFDCSKSQYTKGKLNELQCLACNIFFESRKEGKQGMQAVAEVTINSQAYELNKRRKPYKGNKPICYAVYNDPNRFAWTRGDERKILSNRIEKKAWRDSIYLATQYVGQSGHKKPSIHNMALHCFRYFLSLDYYPTKNKMPRSLKRIYKRSLNKMAQVPNHEKAAWAPFCIGRHIFLRDPKDNSCLQPDYINMREQNGDDIIDRKSFYADCFPGIRPGDYMKETSNPYEKNPLCEHNSLEQATSALRSISSDVSPPGLNDTDANY